MYGTYTEQSDDDITGVFVEDPIYCLGRERCDVVEFKTNSSSSGKRNQKGDMDYKFYSLTKFIELALHNNPNTLELLFAPDNCILYKTNIWDILLQNKDLFISLKSYHSFKGYAFSQMKRLGIKSGNSTGRKDLIDLYQYDPKMCSHTFRLYYECIQLLKENQITLPLNEKREILHIKQGGYPGKEGLEVLRSKALDLEKLCDKVYAESKLRHTPDHKAISSLQMDLLLRYWKDEGILELKGNIN
jgi:predicted nucleotidyltransferase